MIKNLLFTLSFSLLGLASAYSQCTPDPQYTAAGVYPDSATGLADAGVGIPYGETVTIIVPIDTTVEVVPGFPQTLSMDSIVITAVNGLPPGFTYTCASPGCAFVGNSTSCLIIEGTANPGDEGNYPLDVQLNGYVGGTGIPVPGSVGYYSIDVVTNLSVGDLAGSTFDLGQTQPNPTTGMTLVNFDAVRGGKFNFTVVNLLGEVVYEETISANGGENTITFDASKFNTGMYLYSLSNGENTVTKRMVVTR